MSQRQVRARDADRDAAIDIVEAAWVDGQLTREEYEQRTDRLLRAPALRDLEREIVDLQPEGTQWRPRQEDAPAPPPRKTAPALPALACAGMVAAALLAYWLSGPADSPSTASPATESTGRPSLLTSASFVLAREELVSRTGTDAVFSAALTDHAMEFVHPTSSAGTDAVQVTWNGEWGPDQAAAGSGERLSLGLVNAKIVSTIVADARREAGQKADVKLTFRIERRNDRRMCITATATGDTTWTGLYDCQGREMEN